MGYIIMLEEGDSITKNTDKWIEIYQHEFKRRIEYALYNISNNTKRRYK